MTSIAPGVRVDTFNLADGSVTGPKLAGFASATTNQVASRSAGGTLVWRTVSGSVAGADTQVIFNDGGGAYAGNAGFRFIKGTGAIAQVLLAGAAVGFSIDGATNPVLTGDATVVSMTRNIGGTTSDNQTYIGTETTLTNDKAFTGGATFDKTIATHGAKCTLNITGAHAGGMDFLKEYAYGNLTTINRTGTVVSTKVQSNIYGFRLDINDSGTYPGATMRSRYGGYINITNASTQSAGTPADTGLTINVMSTGAGGGATYSGTGIYLNTTGYNGANTAIQVAAGHLTLTGTTATKIVMNTVAMIYHDNTNLIIAPREGGGVGTIRVPHFVDGFVKASGGNGTLSIDTSTYLTAVTAHNLLSATHGDTTAGSPTAGAYVRGDGSKWITSTLILPNTATTGRITYATGTNTLGESSALRFASSMLSVTGNLGISGIAAIGNATPNNAMGLWLTYGDAHSDHVYALSAANTSTGSTANKNRYGIYAESTGVWNGAGAIGYGVYALASGATINHAGYFTDGTYIARFASGGAYSADLTGCARLTQGATCQTGWSVDGITNPVVNPSGAFSALTVSRTNSGTTGVATSITGYAGGPTNTVALTGSTNFIVVGTYGANVVASDSGTHSGTPSIAQIAQTHGVATIASQSARGITADKLQLATVGVNTTAQNGGITYNKVGGTLTVINAGVRAIVNTIGAHTITNGTITHTDYGVSAQLTYGGGATTSTAYGLYSIVNSVYTTAWLLYLDGTNGHAFLGGDNRKTYWGTNRYSTIYNDGTHLVVAPQDGGGTGKVNVKGSMIVDGAVNYGVDAGGTDAYAITLAPAVAAYTTGMMITFYANTINTGAATLNVNGLGAKTIVKRVSTALEDGDIESGQLCMVVYDGTNFVIINPRVH